jgi:hypothetical protein
MQEQTAILSTAYLPPIQYINKLLNYNHCVIDRHEYFIKQTYRSRCNVYSPHGLFTLSIPLVKRNHKQAVKDIKISYDVKWQEHHWRTIEAAYRRSPFFEFYEDDFKPFYKDKKMEYLIDFNEALLQVILSLLKIKTKYSYNDLFIEYNTNNKDDFRRIISPKENLLLDASLTIKPYSQVFDNKYGFIENLSIIDLLFNQGNRSVEFI